MLYCIMLYCNAIMLLVINIRRQLLASISYPMGNLVNIPHKTGTDVYCKQAIVELAV